MKYKVGDKVIIRRDLEIGGIYGSEAFNKNMEQFKGKLVTIIDVGYIDKTSYTIKEDDMSFFWTDEMIECKVYDNVDEFWNDWKNEKVGIKFNSDNEFSSFINDYHFKHFNITCPKGDIINFDTLNYIMIYDKHIPDKWNWVNNNDEITDYNVITYDDFIKLVEKEEKSSKIDKWDKNVPVENTDGMVTFESGIFNKNHILMEQRIENLKNLIIKEGIELNIKKILQILLNENLNVKEYNEYLDIIERLLNIKNK